MLLFASLSVLRLLKSKPMLHIPSTGLPCQSCVHVARTAQIVQWGRYMQRARLVDSESPGSLPACKAVPARTVGTQCWLPDRSRTHHDTWNIVTWFWEFYITLLWLFNNHEIDGLVQERRNSSALAMELRLSYTNPSKHNLQGAKSFWRIFTISLKAMEYSLENWTMLSAGG